MKRLRKSKKVAPNKTCPKCSLKQHPRLQKCKCGFVFYTPKNKKPPNKGPQKELPPTANAPTIHRGWSNASLRHELYSKKPAPLTFEFYVQLVCIRKYRDVPDNHPFMMGARSKKKELPAIELGEYERAMWFAGKNFRWETNE